MPVDFLTDEQASAYGRYNGSPSVTDLQRAFFLDDRDRSLVAKRRGNQNRLGYAIQLTTVRYLGMFLADPLDVPGEVIKYLAEQLGIEDVSGFDAYMDREKTRFEHAWEIQREYGIVDFAAEQHELETWIDAQAWTTGDGPKALFDGAVLWLRNRNTLLPGATTLTRLVATIRDVATQRLWDTLCNPLSTAQRTMLDGLLVVGDANRTSELDRLRKGPVRVSGPELKWALNRVASVSALGPSSLDTSSVPTRRLVELARYGMAAKANLLRRHPPSRRMATLVATTTHLRTSAIDDALDLFDLLMTTNLLARAERESVKEKLRRLPRYVTESVKLVAAMEVLFAVADDDMSVGAIWEQIDSVVPRSELAAAIAAISDMAPASDSDANEEWRAELVKRFATVRRFLPELTTEITFGATLAGEAVLSAFRGLPDLIGRKKVEIDEIDTEIVNGSWRQLVLNASDNEAGMIDRHAFVFCVLEQFHRQLRRRDIYAVGSSRWGDPRSRLLDGDVWIEAKPSVLAALQLPENPDDLLEGHAAALDGAYRDVARRFDSNRALSVDDEGRLHLESLKAIPDPPSLVDLRGRVEKMLPRVDIPELLLEVISWVPGFREAFVPVSGAEARLADLHVTIAALLVAHGCNIGYSPIVRPGVPALTRDRMSHVDQNYLRVETFKPANAALIEAQSDIGLARTWGGGMVASIDGMRFVGPVPTIHARPNPKYFGRGRGSTWLNMINDQAAGLFGMVVSGTPRDSLHMLDVLYNQDGGITPEIIVTDNASYSDLVFGFVHLLGRQYRPQLADLPDQKLWRVDASADYGQLNTAARGKVDLDKIRKH